MCQPSYLQPSRNLRNMLHFAVHSAQCAQVPASVVLTAMAAYNCAVIDIERRHVGIRHSCYAAHIPGMIEGHTWPPGLDE
jgi:hypothetical protein